MQHGAHQGGSRADPTPTLQVHQIVHGEPVAQMEPVVQHPLGDLIQGQTLVPLLAGIPHQKPLTHGGAQGIDDLNLSIRVLLRQLLGGDDGALVGGGKAGGKGQHQNVLSGGQSLLHGLAPAAGVDGRGFCHFPGPKPLVHILQCVVVLIVKGIAPELHGQGHKGKPQLAVHGRGEITAGIGNNLKIHFSSLRYSRPTVPSRAIIKNTRFLLCYHTIFPVGSHAFLGRKAPDNPHRG